MQNETKKSSKCPICGRSSEKKYAPFCSLRCADIDLGRWLKGVYAIASVESTPDEKEDVEEK